jgi:hypothetical protein
MSAATTPAWSWPRGRPLASAGPSARMPLGRICTIEIHSRGAGRAALSAQPRSPLTPTGDVAQPVHTVGVTATERER